MQDFAASKVPAMGGALNQLTCLLKSRRVARVMKLTGIILLAGCLQLSARGLTQTVSISVKDAPLLTVLKAIEKQTSYVFFVDNQWLQKAKKVTITASNVPLQKVLDECFKDQPLTYSITGKVINIIPKEVKVSNVDLISTADPGDVKGRVVNENGEPVIATVTVKGTGKGTNTNENGEFHLANIDENAVLVISGVGIEEKEVRLAGKRNLSVTVKIDIKPLDEVQMIAYGTTTKRFNTGDVASVKASDIEKQPINNPMLALQGRVPGVFVTQNTGVSGGAITVRIRGQNSIGYGNDPLYVVDGVPLNIQLPSTGIGAQILGSTAPYPGVSTVGSPLSFINPSDIESIEVLKDADATSIYGSRAGNGAILITTRKGKSGKTKVEMNYQQGVGEVARKMNMLNTRQYLDMRYEALKNDGVNVSSLNQSGNYDLTVWDTTRYTDWQKTLIGGQAQYINADASVSGGTQVIQYLFGATYHQETTVFPLPAQFADKKGAFHFNVNSLSSDNKFRASLSTNFMADWNKLPNNDLTRQAISFEPDAPPLYNDDGTLNWQPNNAKTSTFNNPLVNIYNSYKVNTISLISNLTLGYKIFKNLELSSSFGYTNMQTNDFVANPSLAVAPENRPTTNRTAIFGQRNSNSWILEPQINYKKKFKFSKLEILLGGTLLQNNIKGQTVVGIGYNSDLLLENILSATTLSPGAASNLQYKYSALFGRANYNLSDKYILDFSLRYDGSSRFGPDNRFHEFFSVGGAWIFSNEKLFSDVDFLSFGKLRASYGTTGNDQIPDYKYLTLYNTYTGAAVAYQGVSGLLSAGLPNPHLQWEETRKMQVGIDLGFLKDRILLNVTFSKNRSSNQLLGYTLASITGFDNITSNFPATVDNSNWEISANSTNVSNGRFRWTTSFNITLPKNKLVDFPNLASSTYSSSLIIGEPITIVQAYHFLGVDPTTGKYIVSDFHGNSTLTPNFLTDRVVRINTLPTLYGGFQNTLSYKNIQLDFLIQFVKQIGANFNFFNGSTALVPGQFVRGFSNQPVTVLNRWRAPGDDAMVQSVHNSSSPWNSYLSNANASNAGYSDASYMRLKNLSLKYQIPDKLIHKIHLAKMSVYFRAQNVFTITNYQGLDPENRAISFLPPLRVFTAGIQLTL